MLHRLTVLALAALSIAAIPVAGADAATARGSLRLEAEVIFTATPIDLSTGEYRGTWVGRATGDLSGAIEGVQTGRILGDTIVYEDIWVMRTDDGATIRFRDTGTARLLPKAVGPESRVAKYQADHRILSATGAYAGLAGRTGFENGHYFLVDPERHGIFVGTMRGTLIFHPVK